jgi:hypothetical protein
MILSDVVSITNDDCLATLQSVLKHTCDGFDQRFHTESQYQCVCSIG